MSGIVCLTAIIPCGRDAAERVEAALLAVGDHAAAHEPGTLGYRVMRAEGEEPVFITHERFRDRDALRAHNEGAGSRAFFAATEGMLGPVTVLVGDEIHDGGRPGPGG